MARVPAGVNYAEGGKHRRGGQFAPKGVVYQRIQDALQSGDYATATELSNALRVLKENDLVGAPQEFQPPRDNSRTVTKPVGTARNYAPRGTNTPAPKTHVNIPAAAVPETFQEGIFPEKLDLKFADGRTVNFSRADVAGDTPPKGVMITAGRELTLEEKDHVAGLAVYLHRIHTGQPIDEGAVKLKFGKRSIYIETKLPQSPNQTTAKEFWGELLSITKSGTPPRKDGSQKWSALPEDYNLVVYAGSLS